jgi:hypothetical protein
MAIPYPVGSAYGAGGDFFTDLMRITVPANSTYTVGQGTFFMMPVTSLGVQMTGGTGQTATTLIASGAGGLFYSDGGGAVKIFNSSGGNLLTQLFQIK